MNDHTGLFMLTTMTGYDTFRTYHKTLEEAKEAIDDQRGDWPNCTCTVSVVVHEERT